MKFIATIIEEPRFEALEKKALLNGKSFRETIDNLKARAVYLAMNETHGNKVQAAKLLGINRNTLHEYYKKLPEQDRKAMCLLIRKYNHDKK